MQSFLMPEGDWQHMLAGVLLVFVRFSGLFVFAPVFSSQALPLKVRTVLLLVIVWSVAPIAATRPGAHVSLNIQSIVGELAVSAVLGLSLALLNELVAFTGQLLGIQFSFSLVNLLDPNSQVQTPLLAQMLGLFEISVLLAAGLHRTILAALLSSFVAVPLGAIVIPRHVGVALIGMTSGVFLAALQLASPVLSATLMVEVGIALMARVSPQLPVLALTVPAKTVIGYVVLIGSLAVWPAFLEARFTGLLSSAQAMIHQMVLHG